MRYLINGGCGFIGSNLAAEVLRRGEELFVLDNLYRFGSDANLQWLRSRGDFKFYPADTRNTNDVETIIKEVKPDYIFHLAGQVAMTTSISNPRLDFETNALGMFNVLDAVRKYSPNSVILFSSTNKVYGDFENFHFREEEKDMFVKSIFGISGKYHFRFSFTLRLFQRCRRSIYARF